METISHIGSKFGSVLLVASRFNFMRIFGRGLPRSLGSLANLKRLKVNLV